MGYGAVSSSDEISTGCSVPLVPISLDPGFSSSDPPPTCMSTHVARFDPRMGSISTRSAGSTDVSSHGETLTLPLRYRDLSRDASIQFRVYAPTTERTQGGARRPGGERLAAAASLSLFDSTGKLRTGLQKLRLEMVPSAADTPAPTTGSTTSSSVI